MASAELTAKAKLLGLPVGNVGDAKLQERIDTFISALSTNDPCDKFIEYNAERDELLAKAISLGMVEVQDYTYLELALFITLHDEILGAPTGVTYDPAVQFKCYERVHQSCKKKESAGDAELNALRDKCAELGILRCGGETADELKKVIQAHQEVFGDQPAEWGEYYPFGWCLDHSSIKWVKTTKCTDPADPLTPVDPVDPCDDPCKYNPCDCPTTEELPEYVPEVGPLRTECCGDGVTVIASPEYDDPKTLAALMIRAEALGIKYDPNISGSALQAIIIAKELELAQPFKETRREAENRLRKEANTLVRCTITCLDPSLKSRSGVPFEVGNSVIGSMVEFVLFDQPWHLPMGMIASIKERTYEVRSEFNLPDGRAVRRVRTTPKFSVNILPPLTEDQIAEYAIIQQATTMGN